jgi:4-oxalomesaconate tautomerase
MVMRGGTSKGAYFVADELPADPAERDDLILRIVGSPDPRQIDGIGGANPLTTKVAVISPATDRTRADVDYLFLQPSVDQARVSIDQNCGNLLAGVAQFAIERGLVPPPPADSTTASTRILMVNTDSVATATFPVDAGRPVYSGDATISGVPGTAAAVRLDFEQIAGSSCGALLPTGRATDVIDGVTVTLIDNGMPVVVLAASSVGLTGYEDPATIEADTRVRSALESIRLQAGPLMNLGDVATTTVPKLTLVAAPQAGGALCTRTLIPHRVHEAIGVLGAVSVATAALLPGSPANEVLAVDVPADGDVVITIEHPTGTFDAALTVAGGEVVRAGIIRTARKLFDGEVFPRP